MLCPPPPPPRSTFPGSRRPEPSRQTPFTGSPPSVPPGPRGNVTFLTAPGPKQPAAPDKSRQLAEQRAARATWKKRASQGLPHGRDPSPLSLVPFSAADRRYRVPHLPAPHSRGSCFGLLWTGQGPEMTTTGGDAFDGGRMGAPQARSSDKLGRSNGGVTDKAVVAWPVISGGDPDARSEAA